MGGSPPAENGRVSKTPTSGAFRFGSRILESGFGDWGLGLGVYLLPCGRE